MNEYLQIVEQWYLQLREPFIALVSSRYSSLSLSEIEDIYQETFLAVHDNLTHGRVARDTRWKAYIFRIGINQANNRVKRPSRAMPLIESGTDSGDDDIRPAGQFEQMAPLGELVAPGTDDPQELERRIGMLNQAIEQLHDPCRTLLRDFYYNGLSLAEIRDELGYKDTDSVKTKRYKCFERLKMRVRAAFDGND